MIFLLDFTLLQVVHIDVDAIWASQYQTVNAYNSKYLLRVLL